MITKINSFTRTTRRKATILLLCMYENQNFMYISGFTSTVIHCGLQRSVLDSEQKCWCTFMIVPRWIRWEWEMFQTKFVEKIKTHALCSVTFFRKSCCLWDNVEKYGTPRQATDDNITGFMRFACWITKATYTQSEYLIPISFPQQQWLRECAWNVTLYAHCLSCCICT
jgi:hypothetical protein